MAQLTTDFKAALDYIAQAKRKQCLVPDEHLPEPWWTNPDIPYLGVGLSGDYRRFLQTGQWPAEYQVYATGWDSLDGVMIVREEPEFDADLRVGIAAENERALRDLLLKFPRGRIGFFYCASEWYLPVLAEVLEGQVLPGRVGYFTTGATFRPYARRAVRKLGPGDYDLVKDQWSPEVWEEVLQSGYHVHATFEGVLRGLCFHWEVAPWRNEVHGLQAVERENDDFAKSVFSSATQEVLELGKTATSTAILTDEREFLETLDDLGYRLFYRVHSFRGIKRGSGPYIPTTPQRFFRGSESGPQEEADEKTQHAPGERGRSSGPDVRVHGARAGKETKHRAKDDPVIAELRALKSLEARQELGKVIVEGALLVARAVYDGLPVDRILYTSEALDEPEVVNLLRQARLDGIEHERVSAGVMGTITSTRPVPEIIAWVFVRLRDFAGLRLDERTRLLIVDSVANPANLGMILRTADASGVQAVVFLGDGASPFHPHCVNAARGAVGRIPLFSGRDDEVLHRLRSAGIQVVGTSARAELDLYSARLADPVAVVVGNESNGLRDAVKEACTQLVRIPMYPGQSSLNVATATAVVLYELVRNQHGKTRLAGEPVPFL